MNEQELNKYIEQLNTSTDKNSLTINRDSFKQVIEAFMTAQTKELNELKKNTNISKDKTPVKDKPKQQNSKPDKFLNDSIGSIIEFVVGDKEYKEELYSYDPYNLVFKLEKKFLIVPKHSINYIYINKENGN